MNDEQDIAAAVTERAAQAPTHRPEFATLLEARQQRLRRRTVGAAAAIVLVGVGGIAALAGGSDDRSTVPLDGPDAAGIPSTMPVAATTEAVWFCWGRVDPPADTPAPIPTTTTIAPPATTIGPTGIDTAAYSDADTGWYTACTPVEPDGMITESTTIEMDPVATTLLMPMQTTTSVDGNDDGGGSSSSSSSSFVYVIETGDYPMLVAQRFCITLDELVAANDWSGPGDFGFPGTEILVPASGRCDVAATTTTSLG